MYIGVESETENKRWSLAPGEKFLARGRLNVKVIYC
jgi:hypothetical protein